MSLKNPLILNANFLVVSILSTKLTEFVVKVLLVKVSVVALPTSVSLVVGRVNVPVLTIVDIIGLVKVLFVKISDVALPTSVSLVVGRVNVPVLTIVDIIGLVKVLFVKISVVALPTSVSLLVGNDKVPVLTICDIIGLVRVLLLRVWIAVNPANVSLASGNDTVLFAVCANVNVVEVAVVDPLRSNFACFVFIVESAICDDPLNKVLLLNVSVVALPISVSVEAGNDNVPVFIICDIVGLVNVLLLNVCVLVNVAIVSLLSGNVNVRVVAVVKPAILKVSFLLASVESAITVDPLNNVLLVSVSAVARPISVSLLVGNVKVPVLII
jgi:hypothetical protein